MSYLADLQKTYENLKNRRGLRKSYEVSKIGPRDNKLTDKPKFCHVFAFHIPQPNPCDNQPSRVL